MKPSKAIAKSLLAGAMSIIAVAANAATYYVDIDSGSHYYNLYGQASTTNLAGGHVTLTISDTFEYKTIWYSSYDSVSGWYKTATVTGGPFTGWTQQLYSSDGSHFDMSYGSFRGSVEQSGFFDGTHWTFASEGWNLESDHETSYVGTTAVPLPGSVWLFGSALVGLVAGRKRLRA